MATSSTTPANSSANFIMALGTGSGIDIKSLAQNLVDAEKVPKQELIQKSIDKSQARISGYATVSLAIGQLQAALDALKDPSAFNTFNVASSLPTSVGVSVNGTGTPGNHEVLVSQLAQAQRSVSGGLTKGQVLSASPFDLTLNIAGVNQPAITVTNTTPEGVVAAINQANLGVQASLVNTGIGSSPHKIVLSGASGADNAFSMAVSDSAVESVIGFDFSASALSTAPNRAAKNALATVDGLPISRSTNQIADAIPGVTLDLFSTTNNAVAVNLTRDVAPVKEKLKQIVTAYNDLQAILDAAEDSSSKVENLGGTLSGDASIRRLRDQVRRIVLPDVNSGSGPEDLLVGLRQFGIYVDTDRKMKIATLKEGATAKNLLSVGDETTMDKLLSRRFSDVAELFSGTNGIATSMSDQLSGSGSYMDSTVRPSSPMRILKALSQGATQRISADKDRLSALETRMSTLLERYTRQFAVMDSLVGESKSTRTGVENSFKGMSASR